MKFCAQCGQKMEDAAQFCFNCGSSCDVSEPVAVEPNASDSAGQSCAATPPSKAKTGKKKVFLIATCSFALVLVAGLVILFTSIFGATPADDFDYEIKNGSVVIIEYLGSDREIRIPEKIEGHPVRVIGTNAFKKLEIVSVRIPKSVTTIEKDAFYCCEQLSKVVFPERLKTIEEFAFYGCSSLTEIELPNGLKTIAQYAFKNCENLSKVTLPDSLEFLGQDSFANCDSLKYLPIPDNTELEISFKGSQVGSNALVFEFISPLGSRVWSGHSSANQYDGEAPSKTVLIVRHGSSVHKQLERYISLCLLRCQVR